jgi:hypothetical protein
MGLRAVFRPPRSVHGSPQTFSEVHWFRASLAHDWRTIAMLCVLSQDNAEARVPRSSGGSGPKRPAGDQPVATRGMLTA